jgi:hypothetical protein
MIDDTFDSVFGFIFRFVKGFIKDIIFDIACYFVGWVALKSITLGRYPSEGLIDGIREDNSEDTIVSIVGLIIILAASYFVFG